LGKVVYIREGDMVEVKGKKIKEIIIKRREVEKNVELKMIKKRVLEKIFGLKIGDGLEKEKR
jgi:hypothetical protein